MYSREKTKIKICSFSAILVVVCFLMGDASFAEEKSEGISIKMKEVSLEQSYQEVLLENRKLKNELNAKEKELKDINSRTTLYATRVSALNDKVETLQAELGKQKEKMSEMKAPEEATQELESLKKAFDYSIEENERLKQELKDLEEESKGNLKLSKLRQVKKEVQKANYNIRKLSSEKEKLMAETGKMHYNLAIMLFDSGDYEKAAYEYERALEFLPNDTDIYYNLAVIYDYYLDDGTKAIEYYKYYLKKCANPRKPLMIKERIAHNEMKIITDPGM